MSPQAAIVFLFFIALSCSFRIPTRLCGKSRYVVNSQAPLKECPSSGYNRYTTMLLDGIVNSYDFASPMALRSAQKFIRKTIASISLISTVGLGISTPSYADDELARYAAEGNKVGVDAQCFLRKCSIETSMCTKDPNCLKGLSCLARCKGGSMCSTGCFAKYGSENLDSILSCSVEKHDCVHVPGKEAVGWVTDAPSSLPAKPLPSFQASSLEGKWYKVMGLDSRYDCFDCQKNTFQKKDRNTLKMEALFRIPRPTAPGYLQSKIVEELHASKKGELAHLKSKGEMFGLTFWENWYVLAESKPYTENMLGIGIPSVRAYGEDVPELKLVYYTGHTLQGSYRGAFLYSRSNELTPAVMETAKEVITAAGLNPNDFCAIKNQCFSASSSSPGEASISPFAFPKTSDDNANLNAAAVASDPSSPISTLSLSSTLPESLAHIGEKLLEGSRFVAKELADWFEDPAILSDWLLNQQDRMVFNPPLVNKWGEGRK